MKKNAQPVWAGRLQQPPDPLNLAYCAGRDVVARPMADFALLPCDIELNQAHALMLYRQRIIDKKSHTAIQTGLRKLGRLQAAGSFALNPAYEDVHLNVEHYLAEHFGAELTGVLHTGRSRNDQAAADVRMYLRAQCLELHGAVCELLDALLDRAAVTLDIFMPGFTHTQPASLTTFAHLLCSHAQALSRDAGRLQQAFVLINQSPLGAAAGFGTAWPIDRKQTALWLGFDSVQENSLDCVTNRWEMEAQLVTELSFLVTHLSILAQDLIFLSAHGSKYIRLPDAFVTGSSIMPQKRNPDFAEVTRAKAAVIQGAQHTLFGIAKGALSGYNRDSQWTKYIALDALDEIRGAPQIFAAVICGLELNAAALAADAGKNFINAIDFADYLGAEHGLPFRKAYRLIGQLVKANESAGCFEYEKSCALLAENGIRIDLTPAQWRQLFSPARLVRQKKSFGGPAAPAVRITLTNLRVVIQQARKWNKRQTSRLEQARRKLQTMIARTLR